MLGCSKLYCTTRCHLADTITFLISLEKASATGKKSITLLCKGKHCRNRYKNKDSYFIYESILLFFYQKRIFVWLFPFWQNNQLLLFCSNNGRVHLWPISECLPQLWILLVKGGNHKYKLLNMDKSGIT